MTPGPCAAALRHDRHHRCYGRRYLLTDPDGALFDFCSTACLFAYVLALVFAGRRPTPPAVGRVASCPARPEAPRRRSA